MMTWLRCALLLICGVPSAVHAQDGMQIHDTVDVAERFLWGEEETVGIAFDASFLTAEARADALDLRQPLGTYEGKDLRLGDVLLDLNLDGLGYNASWRVIGPRTLLEPYWTRLRERATTHSGIHSMGTRRFAAVCACD
jgi:hypothetical protein